MSKGRNFNLNNRRIRSIVIEVTKQIETSLSVFDTHKIKEWIYLNLQKSLLSNGDNWHIRFNIIKRVKEKTHDRYQHPFPSFININEVFLILTKVIK